MKKSNLFLPLYPEVRAYTLLKIIENPGHCFDNRRGTLFDLIEEAVRDYKKSVKAKEKKAKI